MSLVFVTQTIGHSRLCTEQSLTTILSEEVVDCWLLSVACRLPMPGKLLMQQELLAALRTLKEAQVLGDH